MMNAITPFQFDANTVRTTIRDGEPWFVLTDVCQALATGNPSQAASRLDEEDKGIINIDTSDRAVGPVDGRGRSLIIVNESGLYSLILTSRKPAAKRFKKWVTAEVLPSIRKRGRYEAGLSAPLHEAPPRASAITVELAEYIDLLKFKISAQETEIARLTRPARTVRPNVPLTPQELAEMRALRADGLSIRQIALRFDRSTAMVSYVVRETAHA